MAEERETISFTDSYVLQGTREQAAKQQKSLRMYDVLFIKHLKVDSINAIIKKKGNENV